MVWVDCVIFTVINGLTPSEVVIKQLPAIIISLCSQELPLRPCFVSGPTGRDDKSPELHTGLNPDNRKGFIMVIMVKGCS